MKGQAEATSADAGAPDADGECFHNREGIAIIPRGARVPAGFNLAEALR